MKLTLVTLLALTATVALTLPTCAADTPARSTASAGGPFALTTDSLIQPLGIDNPRPVFSWKLRDARTGARQSAYQVLVSTHAPVAGKLTPDAWDSGRVDSGQSLNIPYTGKPLTAASRYFWQVRLWDGDGRPYPPSPTTWWETGLMTSAAWSANWIGYETPERSAVRHAGAIWITNPAVPSFRGHSDTHHGFRLGLTLDKPVQRAALYVTGRDTVATWVNGTAVLQAQPASAWGHMPWKTWVMQDVTPALHAGANTLAVGVTHFDTPGMVPGPVESQMPMSLCLYVLFTDGTSRLITSADPGWKAAFAPPAGWSVPTFTDAAWAAAVPYPSRASSSDDAPGNPVPTDPVMLLRHTFTVRSPVVSARLYATALGAYKFHINGKVVGDQILAPGWMDFRQHVPYQVYDVTADLKSGDNAIAALLAPGWYSTPLKWLRQSNSYGDTPPALKALLRLQHADGSVEWIATNSTWKAAVSPTLFAEIYDGETYDARRVQPGWDTTRLADAAWPAAQTLSPAEPSIVPQYFPPIREEQVLTAKAITSPAPGVFIYDFGQNLSGVPRLALHGPRGTDVRLRYAEVLNADGTVYTDNLRTAKATDHFILAGSGTESYQPQFTYHGYRYIEVYGLPANPGLAAVRTVVFHTDAAFTTHFATANPMVNKLWSNILWGQRSNFIGVPTDCPQRDERLGWTADAQVFWRTAAYNMDLNAFTRKFSADLRGTQTGTTMYGIFAPGTDTPNPGYGTGWSDAGVIIPWTGWIQSGNRGIIDENWQGMTRYLATIHQENPDYLWRKDFGIPFGDWLTPTQTTPEDLIATAYWAYDVQLMRQMAADTGRSAEAALYAELFANIKAAFIKAYTRPDGFVGAIDNYPSIPPPSMTPKATEPGQAPKAVETQTGYVLALYFHLLPDDLRARAADHLVAKITQNHGLLGTGFLGTPYLLEVLTDTGHSDIAYQLLLNRKYPSWGYLIDHGATTTWERWNGDQMRGDPSMNSYNHYAYGAVAAWMYSYAAGVDASPLDAGFHTLDLHPNFDARLGHLSFTYDSPYGTVVSQWTVHGSHVLWTLTVPPNTTALLPVDRTNATAYTVNGKPIDASPLARSTDSHTYRLAAGTYTLTATLATH